ncbi:MAG: TetR/AcrR family transcriptional regulator [Sneathiella sp.]
MLEKEKNTSPLSRSEQKNKAITDAAKATFLDVGFDLASMDKIASVANVSKRTVYSHFISKEALFEETVKTICTGKKVAMEITMDLTNPIDVVLQDLGTEFLSQIFDKETTAMLRILVAQAAQFPKLGKIFLESGPEPATDILAGYFQEQVSKGIITIENPKEAAGSFFASLFGAHFIEVLVGAKAAPDPSDYPKMVKDVVDRFLNGARVRVSQAN